MSDLMIILLCIDAVLLASLFAFAIVKALNTQKAIPCADKEQAEEIKEVAASEIIEKEEKEPIKEEVIEIAPIKEEKEEELEDTEDDRDIVKRIPFAQKMLTIDEKTQQYYVVIDNAFRKMRKINARISTRCVSYRLGRELVAKITIRGKTMKLHLALSPNEFSKNIYFQKDLSDTKSYAEVPMEVKIKSDRGLKKALKLISILQEKKSIENKSRYLEVDSIVTLINIMENQK